MYSKKYSEWDLSWPGKRPNVLLPQNLIKRVVALMGTWFPRNKFTACFVEAAYFRAEKRSFADGDTVQDWVEAEREINLAFVAKCEDTTNIPEGRRLLAVID